MANELTPALAQLKMTSQALVAAIESQAATPALIDQALNAVAAAQQKYQQALKTVPLAAMLTETQADS